MPVTGASTIQQMVDTINTLANEQLQRDGRMAIKQAIESREVTPTITDPADPTYPELDAAIRNLLVKNPGQFTEKGRLNNMVFNSTYMRHVLAKNVAFTTDDTAWGVIDLVNNTEYLRLSSLSPNHTGYLKADEREDALFGLNGGLVKYNKDLQMVWQNTVLASFQWNNVALGPSHVYVINNSTSKIEKIDRATGQIVATSTITIPQRNESCMVVSYDGTELIIGATNATNTNIWIVDANTLAQKRYFNNGATGQYGQGTYHNGDLLIHLYENSGYVYVLAFNLAPATPVVIRNQMLGQVTAYNRQYSVAATAYEEGMAFNAGAQSYLINIGTTGYDLRSPVIIDSANLSYNYHKIHGKRYFAFNVPKTFVHGTIE